MDLEKRTFFLLDIDRIAERKQEIVSKGKIAKKSYNQLMEIRENFNLSWKDSDEKLRH